MPIIKYDPLREIERFFEDDLFGFVPAVRRSLEPAMDVYQTDKDIVVEVQVPKFNSKDIKVTVEDGILKIEGTHNEEVEDSSKHYLRREIKRGSFTRYLSVPAPIKSTEVKATFENGVLKVILPKTEEVKPKAVEVEIK